MKVSGLGNRAGLSAASSGKGDIFNAILWAVIAHGVNVTCEDRGDIARSGETPVNFIPIVAIATS